MSNEHKCDECNKDCSFIEYEHQEVVTQKTHCGTCNWFLVVVDGVETFRGISAPVEAEGDLEEKSVKEATKRVLMYARELSDYDNTTPDHGMFLTLQHVAQALAGLKDSVRNYDETVAYFADKETE